MSYKSGNVSLNLFAEAANTQACTITKANHNKVESHKRRKGSVQKWATTTKTIKELLGVGKM